jgi:very-short-patch-repair endonuclease
MPWWPMSVDSDLEMSLYTRLERAGLPLGEGQYRIVAGRRFTWDRAYPEQRVCVEVQGAIHVKGAHSTGTGIERDCLKASLAAALGWRCLPVTQKMIEDGTAVELIRQALEHAVRALAPTDGEGGA